MFGKSKVSQSMIDAVNKVLGEQPVEQKDQLLNEAGAPIKEPTPTGVRVYGSSYGNSAKAKKDQTKSPVDNLKGPKDKEMKEELKSETFEFHLTEGSYADLHKKWGDTHNIEYHSHTLYPKHTVTKFDNEKDAESHAKKNAGTVRMSVSPKMKNEELKGNQDKIDANHNDKIDAQDFKILKAKKKVKEGREFTEKLLEMVRKSDVPAYLRKAKGDTPLTMADVKAPKKDTISDPKNLAKANETYDVSKIATKPFKSEPKFERNPFKGDHDSLKRPKLTTGLRQSKISPGETEIYIKNSYEFELHESLMDHIEVKPAKKHKDPEILAVHDVHYKGKKVGDIQVYQHGSGMKYGSHHDASGNSTAGHRTMDQAIDDIRQEHAQHLKSMREEVEQIDEKDAPEHTAVKPLVHIRKPQTEPAALIHRNPTYPGVKRPGKSSDDTDMVRKEEVEHLNEDDFAHAKKQGWSVSQHYHHTKVTHPKHGIVSVDRYGEWMHHPDQDYLGRPKGDLIAHGQFDKLNKHLSTLKEASYEPSDAPITTDTLAGRMPGGKSNSFKSFKTRVRPLDKEGNHKPEDDTPKIIQPQETPARKSHEVKEATIAGTSGWEPMKKDVKDKSGAVHTPMSRAKDLARQAFKTVQNKTKVK